MGSKLRRFGLKWTTPTTPVCRPMTDGYWTPWHVADGIVKSAEARIEKLEAEIADLKKPPVPVLNILQSPDTIELYDVEGRKYTYLFDAAIFNSLMDQSCKVEGYTKDDYQAVKDAVVSAVLRAQGHANSVTVDDILAAAGIHKPE